jgi:hypothetical protein
VRASESNVALMPAPTRAGSSLCTGITTAVRAEMRVPAREGPSSRVIDSSSVRNRRITKPNVAIQNDSAIGSTSTTNSGTIKHSNALRPSCITTSIRCEVANAVVDKGGDRQRDAPRVDAQPSVVGLGQQQAATKRKRVEQVHGRSAR